MAGEEYAGEMAVEESEGVYSLMRGIVDYSKR